MAELPVMMNRPSLSRSSLMRTRVALGLIFSYSLAKRWTAACHFILGLCLAIPCLLAYGIYRSVIDRHCTRAMIVAAKTIEACPTDATHGMKTGEKA